jgi:hypothetical protein
MDVVFSSLFYFAEHMRLKATVILSLSTLSIKLFKHKKSLSCCAGRAVSGNGLQD